MSETMLYWARLSYFLKVAYKSRFCTFSNSPKVKNLPKSSSVRIRTSKHSLLTKNYLLLANGDEVAHIHTHIKTDGTHTYRHTTTSAMGGQWGIAVIKITRKIHPLSAQNPYSIKLPHKSGSGRISRDGNFLNNSLFLQFVI